MSGAWNDLCPMGDPGCDAADDGEWHCHDGCTSPHTEAEAGR